MDRLVTADRQALLEMTEEELRTELGDELFRKLAAAGRRAVAIALQHRRDVLEDIGNNPDKWFVGRAYAHDLVAPTVTEGPATGLP